MVLAKRKKSYSKGVSCLWLTNYMPDEITTRSALFNLSNLWTPKIFQGKCYCKLKAMDNKSVLSNTFTNCYGPSYPWSTGWKMLEISTYRLLKRGSYKSPRAFWIFKTIQPVLNWLIYNSKWKAALWEHLQLNKFIFICFHNISKKTTHGEQPLPESFSWGLLSFQIQGLFLSHFVRLKYSQQFS